MKVQLEKSFPMPGAPATTWALLSDIEAVATCMPGAVITERVDETHYKGKVAVKMGPASLSFRGEIEVRQLDPASHTLQLVAKGSDTSGGSGATMDLTATVLQGADAASSTLRGNSTVTMSGKAAAFGSRLAVPMADQVLGQFAANFAAKVAAMQVPPAAPEATAAASATPPDGSASGAMTAPAQAQAINGVALMWAVLKGWLRGLFAPPRP